MQQVVWQDWKRLWPGAMGIIALGLGLALRLEAGDPIQFSTTTKKLDAPPRPNPLEQYLRKPFDLLKPESSLGPVVESPFLMPQSPRTGALTREQRERLEWQKSWIFQMPETLTKQKTTEDAFGLPPVDRNGQPIQRLSPMEAYFQRRDKQLEGFQNRTDDDNPWQRDPLGSRKPGDAFNWRGNAGTDPNDPVVKSDRLLQRLTGQAPQSGGPFSDRPEAPAFRSRDLTLGDVFQEFREAAKQNRERAEREAAFQQLLDNRGLTPTLDGRRDPFNLLGGAGREESLAAPRRNLESYNRTPPRDVLDPFKDAPGPGAGRLTLSGGGNRESLIPLSPRPNPLAPPEQARPRERPLVLPVPKPIF